MCRIALLAHKWGSLSTVLVTSIVTSYGDLSHHIEAILLIYSFFLEDYSFYLDFLISLHRV